MPDIERELKVREGVQSQDVALAGLSSVQMMRDAFIDLQGMPCTLYYLENTQQRRDFYGDIREDLLFNKVGPVRIVFTLGQLVEFLEMKPGTSTNDWNAVSGMVKLNQYIAIGDRVRIDLKFIYPGNTDVKYLQVIKVEFYNNPIPISKKVTFGPVRDGVLPQLIVTEDDDD